MTYRHPSRTKRVVHTLLLSALGLFAAGAMHCAWAQQAPVPLACWKDQGDPQGTNGRDLNGYMFFAPVGIVTRPGRPIAIDRPPPPGSVGIVRPPRPAPPGMTSAMCSSECANRGFYYAGTQYGSYCFCGNQYGRSGPAPPPGCDATCSGNPNEKCGGTWANSVHWTGVTSPPAQGWVGKATCQVDMRGPSYMDSRVHTWTLLGAPTPAASGEVYSAIWTVAGSGSRTASGGSAQWNVLGGSAGPIKVWIHMNGNRIVSADHSQLSMDKGVSGTQTANGQTGVVGAAASEYAFPSIQTSATATVITGASNGATNGSLGFMQPGGTTGTYACSWNFQKR